MPSVYVDHDQNCKFIGRFAVTIACLVVSLPSMRSMLQMPAKAHPQYCTVHSPQPTAHNPERRSVVAASMDSVGAGLLCMPCHLLSYVVMIVCPCSLDACTPHWTTRQAVKTWTSPALSGNSAHHMDPWWDLAVRGFACSLAEQLVESGAQHQTKPVGKLLPLFASCVAPAAI